MQASLRENILFGAPMKQDAYERAVEGACLNPDLKELRDGDETQVPTPGCGEGEGRAVEGGGGV
jgi:hypothetical protein